MRILLLSLFGLAFLFPQGVFAAACTESFVDCECVEEDGTGYSVTSDEDTGDSCATACSNAGAESYKFFCGDERTPTEANDLADWLDAAAASVGIQTITEKEPAIPALNVPIPGLDLEGSVYVDENGYIHTNMIGLYVNAIFSYGITLVSIFAVLMFTLAGFQYMTAGGDKGAVSKAKARMTNTLFGIAILMATYSIAFLIDPRTTRFNSLHLEYIDPIAYIDESGEGSSSSVGSLADATLPDGITCSGGGADALYSIALAAKGKVNYRMGGKIGLSPPYIYEEKKDGSGRPYSEYCPEGTLCLDCSGYSDFLAQCAGFSSLGGSTSQIFSSNTEMVTSCTENSINGTLLKPGDVIGWRPGDGDMEYGHIFTYIGNGKISDASGSGRSNATAVNIYSLTWACRNYAGTLQVRRR